MRTTVLKARFWLRMIATNRSGAAAVEFALVVPFMLLLYIGTFEASLLFSADRRVQTITATVGDLVARSKDVITSNQLRDYFRAAENIITPRSNASREAGLIQTVSMVSVDNAGNTNIIWSRRFIGGQSGHGPGRSAGEPYPLPDQITNISRDGFVVASETSYSFTPLLGTIFGTDFPLYRENFYLPRFDDAIALVGAS